MMQALNGSIVALITPMHENGEVDFESLSNLVEWHIKEGTAGIVSMGTTGESATRLHKTTFKFGTKNFRSLIK